MPLLLFSQLQPLLTSQLTGLAYQVPYCLSSQASRW